MLGHGQKRGDCRAGGPSVRGGAPVREGGGAGRGGREVWGQPADRAPLVSDVETGRSGRSDGGRSAGSAASTGPSATGPGRHGVAGRTASARVQDGPVDPAAHRRAHRAAHRGPVSPGACVVPAPAAELVAPATGPAGAGAQRGGDSAVGGATLASGKKNARRQRAWLVLEDESGILLIRFTPNRTAGCRSWVRGAWPGPGGSGTRPSGSGGG
jgi:hypothetical protein